MNHKRTHESKGLLSAASRFLCAVLVVTAASGIAYTAGAYKAERTLRERTLELGLSGYDTKTAVWGLYDVQSLCQGAAQGVLSVDTTVKKAATEGNYLTPTLPESLFTGK